MSDKIIRFDDAMFESKPDALVRVKVERTINAMPDAEADEIANAAGYERRTGRKAFRAGHHGRTLAAEAGKLSLKAPELKGALFGSTVIERCRRRESGVEEALMEMCLAGVSTRGVDGTGRLLWGERMPSRTLSDKLKKIHKEIDEWRKRPLESEYPYVFVDGVRHKQSWGGHVENADVLVAIGVGTEGRREAIAADEGMREDAAGRERFFRSMIERGSRGVGPVVGDRCAGLVSTVNSMPPNARCQRRMVRFMRDVPSKTPPGHREWASAALKAVFAQENRESAMAKAGTVAGETEERKLKAAANHLRGGVGETAACLLPGFPANHGIKPRTDDMIERLNKEIRRRTRVVGGFPDSDSALMLVCAGIRYVASRSWSDRRYMDMSRLDDNPGAAA